MWALGEDPHCLFQLSEKSSMTAGGLFWATEIRPTPPMHWGIFGCQKAHKGTCVKRDRVGINQPWIVLLVVILIVERHANTGAASGFYE